MNPTNPTNFILSFAVLRSVFCGTQIDEPRKAWEENKKELAAKSASPPVSYSLRNESYYYAAFQFATAASQRMPLPHWPVPLHVPESISP